MGGVAGREPTVLLADDDLSFARGLALLLRSHFRTVIAGGSEEALAYCDKTCPDAALVDLDMPIHLGSSPHEEGVFLARALRQRLGPDFLVVLVTRHEAVEIPRRLLTEMHGFFHKPLCAADLITHLQELIGERCARHDTADMMH